MKRSKANIARENGRKSKGPITVAGKEKSSQNALRHGYTSHRAVLLTNESEQELREFSQIQFDELKPATPAQSLLVEEIIAAAWRLRRIWHAETAFIDMEMARQFKVPYDLEPIDQHMRTARAFESIAAKPQNQLLLLQRYARSLRIQHDRALRQLRDMQSAPPPVAPPARYNLPKRTNAHPRAIHTQPHATHRSAMAYPGSEPRLRTAPTPQPALRAAPRRPRQSLHHVVATLPKPPQTPSARGNAHPRTLRPLPPFTTHQTIRKCSSFPNITPPAALPPPTPVLASD